MLYQGEGKIIGLFVANIDPEATAAAVGEIIGLSYSDVHQLSSASLGDLLACTRAKQDKLVTYATQLGGTFQPKQGSTNGTHRTQHQQSQAAAGSKKKCIKARFILQQVAAFATSITGASDECPAAVSVGAMFPSIFTCPVVSLPEATYCSTDQIPKAICGDGRQLSMGPGSWSTHRNIYHSAASAP